MRQNRHKPIQIHNVALEEVKVSSTPTSPVSPKEQKEMAFKAIVKLGPERIQHNINGANEAISRAKANIQGQNDKLNAAMEARDIKAVMELTEVIRSAEKGLDKLNSDLENYQNALIVANGGEIPEKESNRGRQIIMTDKLNKAKMVIESEFKRNKTLIDAVPDMEKRSWVVTPNSDGSVSIMLRTVTIPVSTPKKASENGNENRTRTTNSWVLKPEFGGFEYTSFNRLVNGTLTNPSSEINHPKQNGESNTDWVRRICDNVNGINPNELVIGENGEINKLPS